jgi:uncharacterized membrane protein YcaP (DUF421 family)
MDIGLTLLKDRFATLDRWLDGYPLILIHRGSIDAYRLRRSRVTKDDLLSAARSHGIGTLDDVEYAILETGGEISIIPRAGTGFAKTQERNDFD